MTYYLEINYVYPGGDRLYTVGGAGFESAGEWQESYDSAPEESDGQILLDKLDSDLDILDTKIISAETASAFLGEDFATALARAIAEAAA